MSVLLKNKQTKEWKEIWLILWKINSGKLSSDENNIFDVWILHEEMFSKEALYCSAT